MGDYDRRRASSDRIIMRRCDCMGLPLTCGNDEALVAYNKALFAHITVWESALPYMNKALQLDESLILAHCFIGFSILSFKPPTDPQVESSNSSTMTEREKDHVRAFLSFASGNLPQATEEWSAVLVDHPLDILALRFAFESYTALGEFAKMRDLLARVLPHWKEDMFFYPFIIALYAFGLEQTNYKDRGEQLAKKALSMEKRVPWATHTLSHVIEEGQDAECGVEFLTSTRKDWCDTLFEGHLTWHLALHHLDLGNTDAALHEFDTVLYKRATEDSIFSLLDATSLLWRVQVCGGDPGEERWQKITENFSKWIGQHTVAWYDVHLMMSLVHGKVTESAARLALTKQMLTSLESYAKSNVSTNCKVVDQLGLPVCNALVAYSKENYSEVLSLLLPLRYNFVHFGGSWAHRQILSVTIIQAAIKSGRFSLALGLVAELKGLKPKSRRLGKLFEELKATYDKQKQSSAQAIHSQTGRHNIDQ